MSWEDSTATFRFRGQELVTLRAGFIIELYGEEPLNEVGHELFDEVFSWFPSDRELFLLPLIKVGTYKEATTRRLNALRKSLRPESLAKAPQAYDIKDAETFEVGEYGIEIYLGGQVPSRCIVSLPLSFARGREESAFDAFRGLVERYPLITATAGYGFNIAWARETEMRSLPVELDVGLRYHGLSLRNRTDERYGYRRLKSVHWLTFIDDALADGMDRAEPLEVIGADVGVEVEHLAGGWLFRAGGQPPVGELSSGAPDLAPMRSVDEALRSIRIAEWNSYGINLFGDADRANAWVTRLER